MRTTRTTIAALALALPLSLAACGSDDSTSGSSDTMTSSAAPSASPSESMSDAMGGEPFGAACADVPADGAGSFDGMAQDPVATAASNNPALSTLVTAVGEAGLADTLNSAEDITVFAPANSAFEALPKETMDAAMADPEGLLTDVLTNHVVEGRLSPEDVAGEHETLGGGTITVEGSGEDFTVTPGDAKVVCGNVQTANATVYIIDQVLVPEG
ncbi:fasciclin domain-containing protein [Phycicoccus sp. CSK15P-2]|uniref:fasciclin domain-containing protein n=1 Tax=Phycicoccus sp. CSK15P-2 TaxID=2807627 RepID=UPI00194EC3C2|nr:fasciclin domain-containing protein [Phycicoccus sp. CSK15P-2]MBM6404493.1 fasciclin domain-containing protein [Phycicoccus sp. CSK15P-2]